MTTYAQRILGKVGLTPEQVGGADWSSPTPIKIARKPKKERISCLVCKHPISAQECQAIRATAESVLWRTVLRPVREVAPKAAPHIEREIKEGLRDAEGNCLHLSGYWINKGAGNWRCYTCQYQMWPGDTQPDARRKIERWEGT